MSKLDTSVNIGQAQSDPRNMVVLAEYKYWPYSLDIRW